MTAAAVTPPPIDPHRHLRAAERKRMRAWDVQESPHTVSFLKASDGWELALSSYSDPARVRRRHPVLLCHGLGASRLS
ncbi:MAG: hypothetical protein ACREJ3_06600, partial [Polyangiaceae bacterium]